MLLLDAAGKERARLEGYLPNNDFMAALKNGLGRIAFVQKKYTDAERRYGDVVAQFGDSHFGPKRCTGGPSHSTARLTITRSWAKSPRNCEANIRPACGRAKQFRGCIRSAKLEMLRLRKIRTIRSDWQNLGLSFSSRIS